jgi:RNA-directed DNA polymerase
VAPKTTGSGGRACGSVAKAAWGRRIWRKRRSHSGGVISDGMVARTRGATGETLPAPVRNHRKLGRSDPAWRFWGLYVHVCKLETLREAYAVAKENDGAPGVDGVTLEAIEAAGVEVFLAQLRDELVSGSYRPLPTRKHAIPKRRGGERILQIPSIRDRVVQGALRLILEPVSEADFQPGSYGYRPKRTAHQAVARVAEAIVQRKTRVIDLDLTAFFDNVQHRVLLAKVATRVSDPAILHVLKLILRAGSRKGLPQGGPLSPLRSNMYLTPVDHMLERAQETTRRGPYGGGEWRRSLRATAPLLDPTDKISPARSHRSHRWHLTPISRAPGRALPTSAPPLREVLSPSFEPATVEES